MNPQALLIGTAAGLAAQLAMVVAGHYVPFIKDNVFALGGMAISLVAGVLYAKAAGGGWIPSVSGGLVAGGLCALLGIGGLGGTEGHRGHDPCRGHRGFGGRGACGRGLGQADRLRTAASAIAPRAPG